MDSLALHYLIFFKSLAYAFFFIAMVVEGDIFLFTAGFLFSRGFLDGEPLFLALFSGTLVGDSLWYWFGYKLNHSKNRLSQWLIRVTDHLDQHLIQNPLRTLFISKFIYSMHHLILGRAGVLKLNYKKFLKYDFVSTAAWIIIVGGLGYLSGASFDFIKSYLKFAEYALVIFLVLFLIAERLIIKYRLKKRGLGKNNP